MRTPGKSPPRLSAGQSFNDEEIALLEVIVKAVLRGGNLRLAQSSPVLGNVARKVAAMRVSVEKTRTKRGTT